MGARGRQATTVAITGGALAGIFGGIVMSLFLLLSTLASGLDPWLAFKAASAPFYGPRALDAGFDAGAVLLSVVVHFAVALGWGLLFGVIFYGASRLGTVLAGAAWGLVVWVAMFRLVLPSLGLGEIAHRVPVGRAALEHLIYGLAVAIGFLPFQRRLWRR
jgi:hypothetical protein